MSPGGPDDDLVRDYLAECREHLSTIEADLLEVERGGAQIDEPLVNRVFRAAHSIKGGAGFFDLTKIRELAHHTETALDLIRSRHMVPTPEVVSILLLAFDKLGELVENYRESNRADISEFVDSLTRLAADHLSADQKSSVTEKMAIGLPGKGRHIQVSAFDLKQARRVGKCIYLIECDLIHDVERRGMTPLGVLKHLMDYGTILDTEFDLESAGTLDDEPSNSLLLQIVYATVLEPDLVGQAVEFPPDQVHVLEKNGTLRCLAAPPAAPPSAAPAEAPQVTKKAPEVENAGPLELQPPVPPPPPAASHPASETTIRLQVSLLESLMTLAGELVLSRNQLNESLARKDERGIRDGAQRISVVTSDLQEVVTQTRMQPIGNLLAKFPRLVRDLARDLGKEVQLTIEGGDVEIDKTILEGLGDPLTHMIRNSVDHGIEMPPARTGAGKPAAGTIALRCYHQAGLVVIEIADDGKGLDVAKVASSAAAKGLVTAEQLRTMPDRERMALIFLPGVSTAEKVSDVSGRGVGMDVVKTNLDKLGGKIEIDSTPGKGTRFRIKLPLTLAIIPSLLISDGGQRFAIPQVNVGELIRIPPAQIAARTDRVGDAEVLILRDRLVPLVYLADALGTLRPEAARAMNVVLVNAGAFDYGLVVEELHDTAEIVVKPLGRHLKGLHEYAGATILGDGRVAVILDVAGLAARAALSSAAAEAVARRNGPELAAGGAVHTLLLFRNAPAEVCAVAIEHVARVERIRTEQVLFLGGRRIMVYRGATLPLVALHDTAAVGELEETQRWVVIVVERAGKPLGLLAAEPLDLAEAVFEVDTQTLRQPGIAGSAVLEGRTILLLDIFELAASLRADGSAAEVPQVSVLPVAGQGPTVLLAEDSGFFRGQIQRLMEAIGCRVLAAEDGQAAWELLERHAAEVDIVTTDIEMPRLDGLALTRQIRSDRRFANLPVIALSSLAGEEDVAAGMAAGVSEYHVKLDRDELEESIRKLVPRRVEEG